MKPCACGYQDSRFCPLHGVALRRIIAAGSTFGADAAESVAHAFAAPVEDVCLACILGTMGEHAIDVCTGASVADSPARRAFLTFLWGQAGEDCVFIRHTVLRGTLEQIRPVVAPWLRTTIASLQESICERADPVSQAALSVLLAYERELLPEKPRPFWEYQDETVAPVDLEALELYGQPANGQVR